MKIFVMVDGSDHEEHADALSAAVKQWIKSGQGNVELINRKHEPASDAGPYDLPQWDLGITFDTNKKAKLKKPLAFLYTLAEELELDFVVGKQDTADSTPENVCYFGYEEGPPEPAEVASYLGLKR